MQDESGFQLIISRQLLAQAGAVKIDYLTGPFRKGFSVKASGQGGGCSPEGCGPSDCSADSCGSSGCAC